MGVGGREGEVLLLLPFKPPDFPENYGFPLWFWVSQVALVVKNLPANTGDIRDMGLIPERKIPWVRKIPWRKAGQPSLVFLPEESHGQRSLVGYSP